ncbi:hypothetical protein DSCO28_10130 [Desulfosarcina ovata subsp. sediminis]|uniref:HNH nuclease domain-containing protein n=1 Tax=Desulfosarcina ovata subsp. sediminis TaxID=885957 RepID=A0A5K7ZKD8_9BACT|nr:HNH endonuclease [Desulfosarcina ovata]BBO80447.1 hypothetical protein DSCO28_10130 [Desulfosarcina ovata subsp. sediminis]
MSAKNPLIKDKLKAYNRNDRRCSHCHRNYFSALEAHHRIPRKNLNDIEGINRVIDSIGPEFDLIPVCPTCHHDWFHSDNLTGHIQQIWEKSEDPEYALELSQKLIKNGWGVLAWPILRKHRSLAPDLLSRFLATEASLSRMMKFGDIESIMNELVKIPASGKIIIQQQQASAISYSALHNLIACNDEEAHNQIVQAQSKIDKLKFSPFFNFGIDFKQIEILASCGEVLKNTEIESKLNTFLSVYEHEKLYEQVSNTYILYGCFLLSKGKFKDAENCFQEVLPSTRLWNYGCARLGLSYTQLSKLHHENKLNDRDLDILLLEALENAAIAESIYAITMCYGWRIPFLGTRDCMDSVLQWHPKDWTGVAQPSMLVTWILNKINTKSVINLFTVSSKELATIYLERAKSEQEKMTVLRDPSCILNEL